MGVSVNRLRPFFKLAFLIDQKMLISHISFLSSFSRLCQLMKVTWQIDEFHQNRKSGRVPEICCIVSLKILTHVTLHLKILTFLCRIFPFHGIVAVKWIFTIRWLPLFVLNEMEGNVTFFLFIKKLIWKYFVSPGSNFKSTILHKRYFYNRQLIQ